MCGTLTATTKMPCKSYSLPTAACVTGYKLAQIPGTVCASCYADKGFYKLYSDRVEPAQHARLESIADPLWVAGMVALIGTDTLFRWHDAGDVQNLAHLHLIADVCDATPATRHWLPTREHGMVKAFVAERSVPANLVIRVSATYPDQPVRLPAALQGVPGVALGNVHHLEPPTGERCKAPQQGGKCLACRACWQRDNVVSYALH